MVNLKNRTRKELMIRPLKGETLNQTKKFYWDYIHTCQELISVIQKDCDYIDLSREVIAMERQIIKDTYADLKEMQQWFNKTGKGKLNGKAK